MNDPANELAETLRDLTSAIVAAYVGQQSQFK